MVNKTYHNKGTLKNANLLKDQHFLMFFNTFSNQSNTPEY